MTTRIVNDAFDAVERAKSVRSGGSRTGGSGYRSPYRRDSAVDSPVGEGWSGLPSSRNVGRNYTDDASARERVTATHRAYERALEQPNLTAEERIEIERERDSALREAMFPGSTAGVLGAIGGVFQFLDRGRQLVALGIADAFFDDTTIFGTRGIGAEPGEERGEVSAADYWDTVTGDLVSRNERLPNLVGDDGLLTTSQLLDMAGWEPTSNLLNRVGRFAVSLGGDVVTDPLTAVTLGGAGRGFKPRFAAHAATSKRVIDDVVEEVINRGVARDVGGRINPTISKAVDQSDFGRQLVTEVERHVDDVADEIVPKIREGLEREFEEDLATGTLSQAQFDRIVVERARRPIAEEAKDRALAQTTWKGESLGRYVDSSGGTRAATVWDRTVGDASAKRMHHVIPEYRDLYKQMNDYAEPWQFGGIRLGSFSGRWGVTIPGTQGLGGAAREYLFGPLAQKLGKVPGPNIVGAGLKATKQAIAQFGDGHALRQIMDDLGPRAVMALDEEGRRFSGLVTTWQNIMEKQSVRLNEAVVAAGRRTGGDVGDARRAVTRIIERGYTKHDLDDLLDVDDFAELGVIKDRALVGQVLVAARTLEDVLNSMGAALATVMDIKTIDNYVPHLLTEEGLRILDAIRETMHTRGVRGIAEEDIDLQMLSDLLGSQKARTGLSTSFDEVQVARERTYGRAVRLDHGGEDTLPMFFVDREVVTAFGADLPSSTIYGRVDVMNKRLRRAIERLVEENPQLGVKLADDFALFEENSMALFARYFDQTVESLKWHRTAELFEKFGGVIARTDGDGWEESTAKLINNLFGNRQSPGKEGWFYNTRKGRSIEETLRDLLDDTARPVRMKKYNVAGTQIEIPDFMAKTPEFRAKLAAIRNAYKTSKGDLGRIKAQRNTLVRQLRARGYTRATAESLVDGAGDIRREITDMLMGAEDTIFELERALHRINTEAFAEVPIDVTTRREINARIQRMRAEAIRVKQEIRDDFARRIRAELGDRSRGATRLNLKEVREMGRQIEEWSIERNGILRERLLDDIDLMRAGALRHALPLRDEVGDLTSYGRPLFVAEQRVRVLDALMDGDVYAANRVVAEAAQELERSYAREAARRIVLDAGVAGKQLPPSLQAAFDAVDSFRAPFFRDPELLDVVGIDELDIDGMARAIDEFDWAGVERFLDDPIDLVEDAVTRRVREAWEQSHQYKTLLTQDISGWAMLTSSSDEVVQYLSPQRNPFAALASGSWKDEQELLRYTDPKVWDYYTEVMRDMGMDPRMRLRPYYNSRTGKVQLMMSDDTLERVVDRQMNDLAWYRRQVGRGVDDLDASSEFVEVTFEEFDPIHTAARAQKKGDHFLGETVSRVGRATDDRNVRYFLSADDQKTGYALAYDPDGVDVVGVFNIGRKGRGQDAIADAVFRGGNKLDAYEGKLTEFYEAHGFYTYQTFPWDQEIFDKTSDYAWTRPGPKPSVKMMRLEQGRANWVSELRDEGAVSPRVGTLRGHEAFERRVQRAHDAERWGNDPDVASQMDSLIALEDSMKVWEEAARRGRIVADSQKGKYQRATAHVERLRGASERVSAALRRSMQGSTAKEREALFDTLVDNGRLTADAKVLRASMNGAEWHRLYTNAEYLHAWASFPTKISNRSSHPVMAALRNAKDFQDAQAEMFSHEAAARTLHRQGQEALDAHWAAKGELVGDVRRIFALVEQLHTDYMVPRGSDLEKVGRHPVSFLADDPELEAIRDELLELLPRVRSVIGPEGVAKGKEALKDITVATTFDRPELTRLVPLSEVGLDAGPLSGKVAVPSVARYFQNYVRVSAGMYTPQIIRDVNRAAAKMWLWWKGANTVQRVFPFNIRNAQSVIWNNMLIGVSPLDPVYAKVARAGAKFRRDLKRMPLEDALANIKGTYNGHPLRDYYAAAWQQQGVLQTSYAVTELGDFLHGVKHWGESGYGRQMITPWSPGFALNRAGSHAMETVEDFGRMAAFVKLYDPADPSTLALARESVIGVHFDYSDLTNLETRIKKWVPFWVWQSRNLQLQFRTLLERPEMVARYYKLQRAAFENFGGSEGGEGYEHAGVPDWWGPFAAGTDAYLRKDSPYWARMFIDFDMPIQDLLDFPPFTEEGLSLGTASAWLANSLGPQADVIGMLVNQDDGYDTIAPHGLAEIIKVLGGLGIMSDQTYPDGAVQVNNRAVTVWDNLFPWWRIMVEPWLVPADPRRAQRIGFAPGDEGIGARARGFALENLRGAGLKVQTPVEQGSVSYQQNEQLDAILDRAAFRGDFMNDREAEAQLGRAAYLESTLEP